jgi:hypothetical protein
MRFRALLTLAAVNALAQPLPLRNLQRPTARHEISILRVNLQDLKPAHGGPSYFSVKRAPYRGRPEIAEVSLYGQEGIAAVRFELIDASGRVLAAVPAARTGDGLDADGYMLKIDVPDVPFRLRIRGEDLAGRAFQNTYQHLFVPIEGAPAAPIPPELVSRFHAGDLRMARAGITGATYQPLASPAGNVIGLRVQFTARFDAPGYYNLTPSVWPIYQNFRWRGVIDMRALSSEGILQRYEAHTDYPLTFDFVPNYVNRLRGAWCVQPPYQPALWDAIMASTQAVKYGVAIPALDFASETVPLAPQRTLFENFRREGASDCM